MAKKVKIGKINFDATEDKGDLIFTSATDKDTIEMYKTEIITKGVNGVVASITKHLDNIFGKGAYVFRSGKPNEMEKGLRFMHKAGSPLDKL